MLNQWATSNGVPLFRWKRRYGLMELDEAEEIKPLWVGGVWLKRLVVDMRRISRCSRM